MNNLYKPLTCLLLCFAATRSFAQKQPVDSFLQQYHVKFYSLPGLPDSVWYNMRFDTSLYRLKKGDSTIIKQRVTPAQRQISDSLLHQYHMHRLPGTDSIWYDVDSSLFIKRVGSTLRKKHA
jgi:hypothetical protein